MVSKNTLLSRIALNLLESLVDVKKEVTPREVKLMRLAVNKETEPCSA